MFTFLSVQNKYNDVLLKRGGTPPLFVGWKGREASGSSLKVFLPLWPAFGPPLLSLVGWAGGYTINCSPPLKIMFSEYVVWRVIIFGGELTLLLFWWVGGLLPGFIKTLIKGLLHTLSQFGKYCHFGSSG